jgi:hypothetical protein
VRAAPVDMFGLTPTALTCCLLVLSALLGSLLPRRPGTASHRAKWARLRQSVRVVSDWRGGGVQLFSLLGAVVEWTGGCS